MRISFIGTGFSANSVLFHLSKKITNLKTKEIKNINITFYDREGLFGYGVAYNIATNHVLLNRPSNKMSIDHNHLDDFSKITNCKNEYVERCAFGKYLKNKLTDNVSSLRNLGVSISFKKSNVIDIERNVDMFNVVHSQGKDESDIIILSTGNNKQVNIYNLNDDNYINNLYENFSKLNEIKPNDNIMIIGSSLSAIDCVNYLDREINHDGKVHIFSRSMVVPSTRNVNNKRVLHLKHLSKLKNKKDIRLLDLVRYFDKECKALDSTLSWKTFFIETNNLTYESLRKDLYSSDSLIQSILVSTNEFIEEIWCNLTDFAKTKFIKLFYRFYMMQRNPMPRESSKLLIKKIRNRKLLGVRDNIVHIKSSDTGFEIHLPNSTFNVNKIINATGQDLSVTKYPLYNNLFKKGLISKNFMGGILIDTETQNTINKNNKIEPNMFCIGPKTIGSYINVNSAEMLSVKAEIISNKIVRMINNER